MVTNVLDNLKNAAAALLLFSIPCAAQNPAAVPPPNPPQNSVQFETAPESHLQEGSTEPSREIYKAAVTRAEQSGDKSKLWTALMSLAWFEHETGHNREAIEYSNRALEIGSELNNPFMIGRSLDWLGWSYSGLGLYELAEQFYQNGVEIGAPKGKITHVAVWGLAAQELGALHFKMGQVDRAKKEIEITTNFARENGISVGVAEGGVHLAEIALVQGRLSDAEALAREALQAAIDCACSPFNTARARVTLAKVVWERAKGDQQQEAAARMAIEEAAAKADQTGVATMAAEARILHGRSLPPDQFQKRYDLVRQAFESLETLENDRRGSAEAQLGKVLLENDQVELAESYIKHGYKVNREMFRKIDNAYILGDLATIRGLSNDRGKMYKDLEVAEKRASEMGTLPAALELQSRMVKELLQDGYDSMALEWAEKGLATAQKLLAGEKNQDDQIRYRTSEAALMEQIVALEIQLQPAQKKSPAED